MKYYFAPESDYDWMYLIKGKSCIYKAIGADWADNGKIYENTEEYANLIPITASMYEFIYDNPKLFEGVYE